MLSKQDLTLKLITEMPLNPSIESDGEENLNWRELYRIGRVLGISMGQVLRHTLSDEVPIRKPRKPQVIR